MEILETMHLGDVLHEVTSVLLIPTVVVLLLLIVFSLFTVGSLIVELVKERRDYRARIPELIARLESAPMEQLNAIVDESGLLTRQKDDIKELISYLYLSEEARIEVAKRLISSSDLARQRCVDRTDAAAKVAPMLGLMGTLIPLGPGILALGSGDISALSDSLLVAFDTTVAGLATAVVCYLVSRVRKRWYADYLVSMEAVFNTLLERGQHAHEQGYAFERTVYVYDASNKRAVEQPLDVGFSSARQADGGLRAGKEA